MTQRTVSNVIFADMYNMGPLQVRQPLPSPAIDYLDPFVLLHHGNKELRPGEDLGLGAHPHRGFSPVTFLFAGSVRHRDSRGNEATVGEGGTQWLHAGSGLLHDEEPVGSRMELIQMWVNSPARHKMDEPTYYPLQPGETPTWTTPEGGVVRVVAGSIHGVDGPIPTLTPIAAAMLELPAGSRLELPAPAGHSAFLYLLDGGVMISDGTRVDGLHMAVFNGDGDTIVLEALESTRALFMSGEPIGEPITTHGPFVMNTTDEIRAAYRDFAGGKMGAM